MPVALPACQRSPQALRCGQPVLRDPEDEGQNGIGAGYRGRHIEHCILQSDARRLSRCTHGLIEAVTSTNDNSSRCLDAAMRRDDHLDQGWLAVNDSLEPQRRPMRRCCGRPGMKDRSPDLGQEGDWSGEGGIDAGEYPLPATRAHPLPGLISGDAQGDQLTQSDHSGLISGEPGPLGRAQSSGSCHAVQAPGRGTAETRPA